MPDVLTHEDEWLSEIADGGGDPKVLTHEDEWYNYIANGGDKPKKITHQDEWLEAIAEGGGGGGGVTVEALTVTENGTYTAPSGKAYSPVNVEVSTQIETAPPRDVNFIDFDGTIVYSYTAEEFLALTEMPPNPDHTADGLTAQGWNWSLAGAKEYVTDYKLLWIGQLYITTDGKTHVYIELFKGRTSPYCGFSLNGTAVIEWGDGQTDTVTGTNVNTLINTKHDYAEPGDYVIKIDVTEGTAQLNADGSSAAILNNATANISGNAVYTRAVKKIRIGRNFVPGNYGLNYIYGLQDITIPTSFIIKSAQSANNCPSLTAIVAPNGSNSGIDNRACASMIAVSYPEQPVGTDAPIVTTGTALANVSISKNVTTMGNGVSFCSGMTELYIPKNVTSIGASAFRYCMGLAELHLTPTTPPTVANSNAFESIAPDLKIFVPSGSLAAYTSATNYPDPSVYTYVEE